MTGVILVTGGTGKTGGRLTDLLDAAGMPTAAASRHPEGPRARMFDWAAPATWDAALDGVSAVYLVAQPQGADPRVMIAFVEAAMARGVRRFVLLSASVMQAGGLGQGQTHAFLRDHAPEWAVLRPSWFMQNFSEGHQLASIRQDDAIYSATGDGKVAFISADDIAAAAFAALTGPAPFNADFILTGPRAAAYDEVAALISAAAGRTITHRRLSVEDLAERHLARGMQPLAARLLAAMDSFIAGGAEDRTTDGVQAMTGRAPLPIETFVRDNAKVWAPAR